jgi:uncharacterized protein YqgV (UPF0045/DUF77 family)
MTRLEWTGNMLNRRIDGQTSRSIGRYRFGPSEYVQEVPDSMAEWLLQTSIGKEFQVIEHEPETILEAVDTLNEAFKNLAWAVLFALRVDDIARWILRRRGEL